jgi:hypothetical protein
MKILYNILYDGREDYNRKKGRRGRAAGFENLEGIKLSGLLKILLKAEVVKRQQWVPEKNRLGFYLLNSGN